MHGIVLVHRWELNSCVPITHRVHNKRSGARVSKRNLECGWMSSVISILFGIYEAHARTSLW